MKTLFLTPTGGRTGSEMMLWYLLQNLQDSGIEAALYARQRGDLLRDMPLQNAFSYPYSRGFWHQLLEGFYHKIKHQTLEEAYVAKLHKRLKPDIWYLNTLTMPTFAALAQRLGVPYMVHVHELPQTYDDLKYHELVGMLTKATKVIGCSSIVVERLRQMGLTNAVLLHSFIDHDKIVIKQNKEDLRADLEIPADAFVWAMSGTLSTRKGYDLVPDLLRKLPKNAYIIWLGHSRDTGLRYYVEQCVAEEKLNFKMLGAKSDDYYDYLNIADGFALLSREDPFPLVMMEAAYLQKPIVGFESGGISEFLQDGMGGVVRGFDLDALAVLMQKIMAKEIVINPHTLKSRSQMFGLQQIKPWIEIIKSA